MRRLIPLVLVALGLTLLVPHQALGASGSGSAVALDAGVTPTDAAPVPSDAPVVIATGSGSAAPVIDVPDDSTLAKDAYNAIMTKDWFLLAGALLGGLIQLVRWLLAKKWPTWQESHYGVFLAAGMAGLVALTLALLAPGASTAVTLLGALKLLAAATVTYVVPKKLIQGATAPVT